MKRNGSSFGRFLSVAVAVGLILTSSIGVAKAQALSAGVADVGKLAGARVPEDTIINYIKSSGVSYHLTPDDIIYLTGQGVTPNVMSILQGGAPAAEASVPPPAPAPQEPPPAPAPPPPDGSAAPAPQINLPYFQTQLSPYGTWVDMPPYGAVWRPGIAISDQTWRPYCQGGHWVMTDAGWYWQADDPWGSVVFHYGRWLHDDANGWVWVPGYNWAPSWVSWRRAEGCYGWAPLPPQAEFVAGVGISVGGVAVGASFDFGLRTSAFTFVGYDHLWERDYAVVAFPAARVDIVFGGSVCFNSYHEDHGRLVVAGFGHDDVVLRTGHPVEVVEVRKQVVVEHTTVINNVTSVRNVNIRNNVTNVRNVTETHNVNNVNNVNNVKNVQNVNNTHNVANARNETQTAAQHPAAVAQHPAATTAQHPVVTATHPAATTANPAAPHTPYAVANPNHPNPAAPGAQPGVQQHLTPQYPASQHPATQPPGALKRPAPAHTNAPPARP